MRRSAARCRIANQSPGRRRIVIRSTAGLLRDVFDGKSLTFEWSNARIAISASVDCDICRLAARGRHNSYEFTYDLLSVSVADDSVMSRRGVRATSGEYNGCSRPRPCKNAYDSFIDAKDHDLVDRGSILSEFLEHESPESNSAN
jgi:hypothetical protein